MHENGEMAEDDGDERKDDVPSPGPDSHPEYNDQKSGYGNIEILPYVLRDRLTLANPILQAPTIWRVREI